MFYGNKNLNQAYTFVGDEGPMDARIILLGESPWINEVAAGRPFSGAGGNLLKRWWGLEGIGFQRSKMRLMNLFPYRPPGRELNSVPANKIIKAIEQVHERIAALRDPYVIVPMGNYATYALTGKGKIKAEVRNAFSSFELKVTEAESKAGISQLRGSIYPYQDLNGRIIKVMPMIHPSNVLQMPKWEKRTIKDWIKVRKESESREFNIPNRNHIINPTQEQISEFCQKVYAAGGNLKMSIDIETWGNQLSCVGFAISPWESITLSTIGGKKHNLEWVKWLCECDAQKVLQNGHYDWYWLDCEGIGLKNFLWDTSLMHHALDASESHSLDFLASIYCQGYTYWKDEAKEAEEIVKYAKNADALYVYNGLDCCYTRELVDCLEGELRKEGMLDFYFRHYAAMLEPLLRTMRHGIRVDVEAQKAAAKELRKELKGIHQKLNELAGEELFATEERTELRPATNEEFDTLLEKEYYESDDWGNGEVPKAKWINREARILMKEHQGLLYMISGKNAGMIRYKVVKVKKDFSKDKLMKFFYETLGLPKQRKLRKKSDGSRTQGISLDEDSIRKLMIKHAKAVEPGGLLLEYRGKKKELDYLKGAWDKDGRIRCTYKLLTNAGRLASAKNPKRTGYNLQNLKR